MSEGILEGALALVILCACAIQITVPIPTENASEYLNAATDALFDCETQFHNIRDLMNAALI